MSRNRPAPYFPEPPQSYSPEFMRQVTRAFAQYVSEVRTPGEGRNTTTVLTNLATDDANLEDGTVYRDGTILHVVVTGTPGPAYGGTAFNEAVDDRVAALLTEGTNVTLTYNDGAGTLTIDATGGGGSGTFDLDDGTATAGGVFTFDDGGA